MPRRTPNTDTTRQNFQLLDADGPDAPSIEEKLHLLTELRQQADTSGAVDRHLLEQNALLRRGLLTAKTSLTRARQRLDEVSAPPHLPATFLGPTTLGARQGAVVMHGQSRRVVPVVSEVDLAELGVGDEVLLNRDLSVIVARAENAASSFGELAHFERMIGGDRMLVRWQDERIVVGVTAATQEAPWEPGDLVRVDRQTQLARERIEREPTRSFMLDAVPDLPLDSVGGQDDALHRVIGALTLAVTAPERAAAYRLGTQRTVLLHGPPGTGKTLIARVAAAHVQRVTGERCFISVVKPGEFENEYVGVTQRRIRECFDAMRRSCGFSILFLDEIESIARRRGGMAGEHADKFLAALLAEMQGFASDGTRCAIIAATNRLELLDPALVDRMELQLPVRRPTLEAARAIFSIHLPPELPFAEDDDAAMRSALIERAVSRLYSPNADNRLATIRFRDGTERSVHARELTSGRMIEQICIAACQSAAYREAAGGPAGLDWSDLDDAVTDAIERRVDVLSRRNVRDYLDDLPQDLDVVAVEPFSRPVRRPHRYHRVA